jgi:hypothetical protein
MRSTRKDEARAMRSTKPCGPDTPTLVSSCARLMFRSTTVTTKPGTPRRARSKSSNIARGMPDVFGCTCGLLVCSLFAHFPHTRLRVQRHPAFPAPFRKGDVLQNPGRPCRGNVDARHCERSEAIHSAASGDIDCFVASLLAMTAERRPHPTNPASASAEMPPAPHPAPTAPPIH